MEQSGASWKPEVFLHRAFDFLCWKFNRKHPPDDIARISKRVPGEARSKLPYNNSSASFFLNVRGTVERIEGIAVFSTGWNSFSHSSFHSDEFVYTLWPRFLRKIRRLNFSLSLSLHQTSSSQLLETTYVSGQVEFSVWNSFALQVNGFLRASNVSPLEISAGNRTSNFLSRRDRNWIQLSTPPSFRRWYIRWRM